MNEEKDEGVEVKLSRDLGLFDITMIGIGAMIGAGIFVLTGSAVGVAGPAAILAFCFNGVIALLTGMAYAELGSAYPEAGGGYLWAKDGLSRSTGFLSGWMSWVAHMIACSLYAVAFAHYVGWLLGTYNILPFGQDSYLFTRSIAIVVIIFFIGINYIGAETTGKTEGIITLLKIAILGFFVGAGIWAMAGDPTVGAKFFDDFLPRGGSGILLAMGLTFIAFEGYEIIAQSGEEVKNPKKNIPRAIFISIGVVVIIYVLVMIVALGIVGWEVLGEGGVKAMVIAATSLMGPIGFMIMIAGGLLSTTSALNATIYSSSRVSFAMGRDGSLSSSLGRVHGTRKTPYNAIIVSGVIIGIMAMLPTIEIIAGSANVMFLLLFIIANMSLITLRKKRPDLDRGFKVPLFPFIPLIAIFANISLAIYILNFPGNVGQIAWYITGGWIIFGLALYYPKAKKEIEEIEGIKPLVLIPKVSKEKYHVLLPIADTQDTRLVEFSALVSKVEDANMTLLNIIEIPRTLPIDAVGFREVNDKIKTMEHLKKVCKKESVKARAKVTISHTIAETIIDEVKDENINLLVLGWRGYRTRGRMMGTNIDYIAQNAPCDVVVFRTKGFERLKKILVLSGVEWHVSYATGYAILLAKKYGAEITILSVISHESKLKEAKKYSAKLEALCQTHDVPFTTKVIKTKALVSGVVDEAKKCDLLVMGASAQWRLKKYVFGYIQDRIARKVDCPALMLRKVRRRN